MPLDRHRPRKRFGQHFLAPEWADKLVKAIAPEPDQTFVEIGPGEGALTRPLASRAAKVVAVEIDRDLAAALRGAAIANVTVVEDDFLTVGEADLIAAIGPGPVRLAANLPYNVASPILFRLAAIAPRIHLTDATVMLQREVADRLTAASGTRDYGVLTILLGRHASVERLFRLPPGAFRPPPKVHSAVVRLRFHPPDPPVDDEAFFEEVVQAAFTRRRKTLANALLALIAALKGARHNLKGPRHNLAGPHRNLVGPRHAVEGPRDESERPRHDRVPDAIAKSLADTGLAGHRRPETLAIPEWVALAGALGRHLTRRG